jgi:hypothetical protein
LAYLLDWLKQRQTRILDSWECGDYKRWTYADELNW